MKALKSSRRVAVPKNVIEFSRKQEGSKKQQFFRLTTAKGWVFVLAIFILALVLIAAILMAGAQE